ncbi:putative Na+-dependent transporter [Pullulanibacillus pueri]|uniref:Bile acid:sodium symporter family protein n=1 Tax=Pullulanibacillus pueri TaxID=1437324 RepID=A0A8J3ELB9_9BACL|nr:bile acid:sodium symporter family protein [Pullulanibacillus pueri]MBM7680801.1 putative Na+-dependent transporter [Pullulanibacillus pueri]GGH78387.1 hypothetical protein GCM10007096_11730 [Pullulanibacillus pueri]
MLNKVNRQLEKMMPLITPTGVIIGVLLAGYLKEFSFLIPWIFAFMTFTGSLGSNFNSLKEAVVHPFPVLITLFSLHIMMPLCAWGLGQVIFSGDHFTITGLVLSMVIPTGITSFIWVSMYKGHATLTLSIILIDTLLSPFIVPYSLHLIVGQTVTINPLSLMMGLLQMIVIPSLVAMALNQWTRGKAKTVLSPRLSPFSKMGLGIVVMLNGAVVAPYLRHINMKLFSIALVVLVIALSGYVIAFLIGKLLKQPQGTVIAMTYTGGMRNISAGAVLAVSYFPAPVVVPVVIGMLFQQVLASLYGLFLNKIYLIKDTRQQKVS